MDKDLRFRKANYEDFSALSKFISFEYFIHRHLDWRTALDWLGQQPFLIAEQNHEIVACFAAPNDVPTVSWVRLFACTAFLSRKMVWDAFIDQAIPLLHPQISMMAALGLENWFRKLLESSTFSVLQQIIVFEREKISSISAKLAKDYFLRPLEPQDLQEVSALDAECFPELWQMPVETMNLAYLQSDYATVIEVEGKIISYQISTESLSNVHLARIAVRPTLQSQGIASAILSDLISHYQKIGIHRFSVNTQSDNLASQALYKKFGFQRTTDQYPVYTFLNR